MSKAKVSKLPFRTDAGNAELFAGVYKERLRYDHKRQRWLVWGKHWWREDADQEVIRLAVRAAHYWRPSLAKQLLDGDQHEAEFKWAAKSESRQRLEAALALAQSDKRLSDSGDDWDSNPWLLGVPNGVVDLRTGKLRKGKQADRITLHTDSVFDPSAQCPRWTQFLVEVFDGNTELVEFVQRAVGYSITGRTSEQCLFLCYGDGSNGKSTMLETLRFALGQYAYNLPFSALELNARPSISNDVAALPGRRLVTASETNESVRLNEARVKALTGCDALTARLLYRENFQFCPVAKLWLSFNHRPRVVDDSHGFWRRVRLIPFLHQFSESEADSQLLEKLKAEAPGILAWVVRGCIAWQAHGLGMPSVVRAATEAYRQESDALGQFLDERCVIHAEARVTVANLWLEYVDWTKENAERWPLDRASFTERLERRGFQRKRHGHKRDWHWLGICRRFDAQAQSIPPAEDSTGSPCPVLQ